MEKKEILEKASKKKAVVGEAEARKAGRGNWISMIFASVCATAFCIAEGALHHLSGMFAILCIFATWSCVFYTLQYFLAKRPWPVLIGAVLEGLAAVGLIVCYILCNVYGW